MTRWQRRIFLIFIGITSGLMTCNAQSESVDTYDVGCYAKRAKLSRQFGYFYAITNSLLPVCLEGGIFRNYQCHRLACYCVYTDTGNPYGRFFSFSFLPVSISYLREHACNETTEIKASACQEPPLVYECDVTTPKYVFDVMSQTCTERPFGCRGFKTLDECENTCVPQVYDACSFPKDGGNYCEGRNDQQIRYRHTDDGKCVPFTYLGCGGNANNYNSGWECQKECITNQEMVAIDIRVNDQDRYNVTVPLWLVNKYELYLNETNDVSQEILEDIQKYAEDIDLIEEDDGRRRFSLGGVSLGPPGQGSLFGIDEAALQRESSIPLIVCEQPAKTGLCRAYKPRWYYDNKQSKCVKFVFGGCAPNGNNFRRSKDCTLYCNAAFTPSPLEEATPPKDGAGRPIPNPSGVNTGSEIDDGEVIFQVGGAKQSTYAQTTSPATYDPETTAAVQPNSLDQQENVLAVMQQTTEGPTEEEIAYGGELL